MKTCLFALVCFAAVTVAADRPLLWRDPGPVQSLDLAVGPGGAHNAPKSPFRFIEEEKTGITPKVVVTDASGKKWMVKFGDEAKAETFASRMAWAAGYPVRVSYYIANGRIDEVRELQRAKTFIDSKGSFHGARFQMFDNAGFREIEGGKLDLNEKRDDPRELNGLKLTLLLLANWDVKTANTGVFEIDGRRYASVTDWGASLGDPASPNPAERKWNCEGFDRRTQQLTDGVENGYVRFNYTQYAARHEHALSAGIRVEDLKWLTDRMGKLTDKQLRSGLLASGASPAEASCFTSAIRSRLKVLAAAAQGAEPEVSHTRTVTKTTTKKVTK